MTPRIGRLTTPAAGGERPRTAPVERVRGAVSLGTHIRGT